MTQLHSGKSNNIIEFSTGQKFIPVRSWGSKQDKDALVTANSLFDNIRLYKPYVVLIKSYHQKTKGYWIELKKCNLNVTDRILKGGETIQI